MDDPRPYYRQGQWFRAPLAGDITVKEYGDGPGRGYIGNLETGVLFGPLSEVIDDGKGKYITGIFPSKLQPGQTAFVTLWCSENKHGVRTPHGVR